MTQHRRRGFTLALVLSFGAHGGLFVAGQFYGQHPRVPRGQDVVDVYPALPVKKQARWTTPPVQEPRLGARRINCPAPTLQALQKRRNAAGRVSRAAARLRRQSVSGSDLDELRFRPYNHRHRDTPLKRADRRKSASFDNRHREALAGLDRESVQGRGRARVATGRAQAGAARSRAPNPSRPSAGGASIAERSPRGRLMAVQKPRSQGKAGGERLSRAPLEGEAAPARKQASLRDGRLTTRRERGETGEQDRQAPASTTRLPQRVDMARPSGQGVGEGKRRGGAVGRKGSPTGKQRGAPLWLHTRDLRYVAYFRKVYAKIQPRWRFPKKLELRLEQGEVLLEFVVASDGSLRALSVRRSSGHGAFDRNALDAVRAAAPFDPIPAHLAARELRILAPFEFSNPLVR
ncbi:MAG: TonB family protein [Deltaproteobacteria bacterium]|nr:TonB family protein [Deltaproteobacteria bacterium]